MSDENRALAIRWVERVWNARDETINDGASSRRSHGGNRRGWAGRIQEDPRSTAAGPSGPAFER